MQMPLRFVEILKRQEEDRIVGGTGMTETRKEKVERLENALLEYIERHTKDTQPEIAATIPTVAMALVELWKII